MLALQPCQELLSAVDEFQVAVVWQRVQLVGNLDDTWLGLVVPVNSFVWHA